MVICILHFTDYPVHCIETLGSKHTVTGRSTLKERSSEIRRLESRIYNRSAALSRWQLIRAGNLYLRQISQ